MSCALFFLRVGCQLRLGSIGNGEAIVLFLWARGGGAKITLETLIIVETCRYANLLGRVSVRATY